MRNLFIISSDKPSRLHNYTFDGLALSKKTLNWKEARHVYITNDEEIKEGDWVIDNDYDKPLVYKADRLFFEIGKEAKKIILTTDPDLIKNGVQAIDDEFLEWFVKNPSCEEVEVEIESKFDRVDGHYHDVWEIIIPTIDWSSINPQCKQIESCSNSFSKKCICPKEETNGCIGSNGISDPKLNEVQLNQPKQETLEEAVERIVKSKVGLHYFGNENSLENLAKKEYIIEGAKWQQEQDKNKYSEEEVKEILRSYADWSINGDCTYYEWFEQFKKK